MLLKIFIFAAFWACDLAEAITTNDCPSGLKRDNHLEVYGKSCFEFEVDSYKTYDDAQNICQKNKGNLAVVTSGKMNQFLQTAFRELSKSSSAFWIGLEYNPSYGNSYYVDHRWAPFYKYENYRSQPIVENNECVSMSPSDGKWQIEKCSNWSDWEEAQNRFVCEYKATTTTTTTTNAA